jgi:hypothetical protein
MGCRLDTSAGSSTFSDFSFSWAASAEINKKLQVGDSKSAAHIVFQLMKDCSLIIRPLKPKLMYKDSSNKNTFLL